MSTAKSNVTATLSIATNGASVEAHLVYKNVSDRPAFLYRVNALLDGAVKNDVFEITADGGSVQIEYQGILAKRRRPILEDYQRLEPGQTAETRVALHSAYKFLAGRHEYCARYSAFHTLPEKDEVWQLVSNDVRFVLGH